MHIVVGGSYINCLYVCMYLKTEMKKWSNEEKNTGQGYCERNRGSKKENS